MEFKKLEIEPEGSWFKQKFANPRFKRTVIYTLGGAVIGFMFFFLLEGMFMDKMSSKDIVQSAVIGAFMGFFITNSPCARWRC